MALINDRDLPELGFPELDAEHRRVVSLINDLHEASIAGKDGKLLRPILDDLLRFTKVHFQDEEQVMASTGYPALARHKEQHEELLAKLTEFQESEEAGSPISIVSMLELVKGWLEIHVAGEDIRLVIWHRSRRGSQPAWSVP
jgi:hemerythrin